MKRLACVALLTSAFGLSTVLAGTPLVRITVRDFTSLERDLSAVADAVSPGSAEEALRGLGAGLGITSLEGVDANRPWQIDVWMEALAGAPGVSLRIPVDDYDAFTDAYQADRTRGVVTKVDDYASIWMPGAPAQEAARATHDAWKASELKAGTETVRVEVTPNEVVRGFAVQMVGTGRTATAAGLRAGSEEEIPGMDMEAMVKLIGVYFDVIETGLKGLEGLTIGLEVRNDTLRVNEQVTALAGSELASWFEGDDGSLAGVLPFLSQEGSSAFAMRLGKAPAYLSKLKEYVTLAMQMQKVPDSEQTARDIAAMMDTMTPLSFAGTLNFDQGIDFAGLYQFPDADAASTSYRTMVQFLTETMQSQTGDDGLYRRIDFTRSWREVAGTPVDRLVMEINLDSPLYQMPGQKEIVEAMWQGGRMEFDYALRGRELVVSSPANMADALQRARTGGTHEGLGVGKDTVLFARVNVLQLGAGFITPNPFLPEEVKAVMKRLDPAGTDVTLRADLDGKLSTDTRIPIALFRSIGNAMRQ
jgi:hypothetical protein